MIPNREEVREPRREIVKSSKAPTTRRERKIAKLKAKIMAGKYRIDNIELAKALICGH